MKKYKNGEYVDIDASEKMQLQFAQMQSVPAELSDDEKISVLLSSIPVEKPNGGNDLPFKLGNKWVPYYDGSKFAWHLVPDPDAIGTADNPIYWCDDGSVPLIENAYYIKDDIRYVYMAGQFVEF